MPILYWQLRRDALLRLMKGNPWVWVGNWRGLNFGFRGNRKNRCTSRRQTNSSRCISSLHIYETFPGKFVEYSAPCPQKLIWDNTDVNAQRLAGLRWLLATSRSRFEMLNFQALDFWSPRLRNFPETSRPLVHTWAKSPIFSPPEQHR